MTWFTLKPGTTVTGATCAGRALRVLDWASKDSEQRRVGIYYRDPYGDEPEAVVIVDSTRIGVRDVGATLGHAEKAADGLTYETLAWFDELPWETTGGDLPWVKLQIGRSRAERRGTMNVEDETIDQLVERSK